MSTGTVVDSVEDVVAVVLEILESAQHEIAYLAPPSFLSIAGTFGTVERANRFIQKGGVMRAITTVSPANVDEARMRLDVGQDLRHCDALGEIFMFVGDRQRSVSMINIGVHEYTLDTPITAFWSENPTYAEYLLASFANAWLQGTLAEERIRELLEHEA